MRNSANTILEQLGGNKALAMLGVKTPVATEKGLSLRIQGCRTINHLGIELADDDTYTVTFTKITPSYKIRPVSKHEGVYVESLADVIYNATGLLLSL